ncbi:helix-turn-helix transcriptional regulator [Azonexus sp. IMCC34842]|uniref:helix-turn-helix transcriptional regulator n=1 Tax=Azonexus sp. IMCC34842 TaxID=3420950 RepID=UPI003D109FDB
MSDQSDLRILRLGELCAKLQVSKATVYSWMNSGSKNFNPHFPRPVRLGRTSVGWIQCEVHEFLRKRIAERDSARRA